MNTIVRKILELCSYSILAWCFLTCVSPRKVDEKLAGLRSELRVARDSIQIEHQRGDSLNRQLLRADGGNEMLLIAHHQLQDRLLAQDDEIERLSGNLSNTQSELGRRLGEYQATSAALQDSLSNLRTAYRQTLALYNLKLESFGRRVVLDSTLAPILELRNRPGSLSLTVPAATLFASSKSARVLPEAREWMSRLVSLLENEPLLELAVVGHLDNQDRYDRQGGSRVFSAQRAAAVSRVLTEELYLSSRRVAAVGMGAAQPRQSNDTPEGQTANRRIEFRITNNWVNLLRRLEKLSE